MAEQRKQPTNPVQKEERAGAKAIEPGRRPELVRPGWTSPFSFMRRFMNDMDRMFEDFGLGSPLLPSLAPRYAEEVWAPRVDVFERDANLVVRADLPGLRQDDVRVTIEDDVLTISGERTHEHEHEKGGVYQCERSYGRFERGIVLPAGVDPDRVEASFDNGVLEITMPMPKEQTSKGKSIPVRSATESGTRH
jgi:HSP20 family protein